MEGSKQHLFRKASGQELFRTVRVYMRLRACEVPPRGLPSSLTLGVDAYGRNVCEGEPEFFTMELGLQRVKALERQTLAPSRSLMLDLAALRGESFHSWGSWVAICLVLEGRVVGLDGFPPWSEEA